MPIEITGEELLAEGDGSGGIEPIDPVCLPGLLAGLDDHRGQIAAELVGVDLEPAVRGALEGEGECLEGLRGPEPDVAALAPVELRFEYRLVPLAGLAVGAVCRDNEVRVLESGFRVHFPLEGLVNPELRGPLLQDREQALAADTAESVAAAHESPAPKVDVDIIPVVKIAHDGGMGAGIGGVEVRHRLVGEDDAPAEGIAGPVALVDLDAGRRQGLAQQDGGVEPGRAAPQADDSLHGRRPRAGIACIMAVLYCQILEMSSIIGPSHVNFAALIPSLAQSVVRSWGDSQ